MTEQPSDTVFAVTPSPSNRFSLPPAGKDPHKPELLQAKDPHRYQAILDDLRVGDPVHEIAERHHISPNIVSKMRKLHAEEVPDFNQVQQLRLERIMTKQTQRYEQALDAGKVNPNTLPISYAVYFDKLAMAKGDATQRVEHAVKFDIGDLSKKLASIPRVKIKIIEDAEVVSPQTEPRLLE
jgi:hypothetical protein